MLFENLLMEDVRNPIIIDQKYCPYYNCEHKVPAVLYVNDVVARHVAAIGDYVSRACEKMLLACSTCPG
jgi:hypothetical protein